MNNIESSRSKRSILAIFCMFLVAPTLFAKAAQIPQMKIENPDQANLAHRLGHSIAVDADTMVIGAPDYQHGYTNEVALARVYVRNAMGGWDYQTELIASDRTFADRFGYSVSLDDDTVVIGAPADDDLGTDSGSAYVFVRSGTTWTQQAKLIASDGAATDAFGWSLSVSRNTVVVGAPQDDDGGTDSGSAYVFTRSGTTWTRQAKIAAPGTTAGARFGASVCLSTNTAVVGAERYEGHGKYNGGAAYVFYRSSSVWSQQAILVADDLAHGDFFGKSVSVSGGTAVIGAYMADTAAKGESGAAYVFARSGTNWTQQAKLVASDAATDDVFGCSVAVLGDKAVIGAYADDDGGMNSGAAYVFSRTGNTWTQQAKIAASDAKADAYFGCSVALSAEITVVGAYRADRFTVCSGAVYLFAGTALNQQAKIYASFGAGHDVFGSSVAISGDTALIGAPWDNRRGAVYVYTRNGSTWTQQAKILPSDGAEVGDNFGGAVAISGDTAIVGAQSCGSSGAAYVFVRNNSVWVEQAKLTDPDLPLGSYFGISVAIAGDMAIVGAHYDDWAGQMSGSAYVFSRIGSTWSQQAKLTASDAGILDLFGASVAILGDTAFVCAPGDETGSAYVYTRLMSQWNQTAKLTPSTLTSRGFGYAVSLVDDQALIGAYSDDIYRGSAFVFKRLNGLWSEEAKLTASDGKIYDYFGCAVSILDDTIVVGANGEDDAGESSGSAYVFRRCSAGWREHAKLKANDAAAGDEFGASVSNGASGVLVGARFNADPEVWSGAAYLFDLASKARATDGWMAYR